MYIHFNGNPCGKNIGDCVIRAISIVTGYDRHKVYAGLCLFGFPCTIWGNFMVARRNPDNQNRSERKDGQSNGK